MKGLEQTLLSCLVTFSVQEHKSSHFCREKEGEWEKETSRVIPKLRQSLSKPLNNV